MLDERTTVVVIAKPDCDFCGEIASFNGRTVCGTWAFMCEWHFVQYGNGLGLGRGQRLVVARRVVVESEID